MKKHLMAISLSLMTVFTCLVLWLTPKLAFDEVIVMNEMGDASVLDGKTVSGSFFYDDTQQNRSPASVGFDWIDGESNFMGDLSQVNLSQAILLKGQTNAKQLAIEEFPLYNRPNLDGVRLLQTAGDLQVWVGVQTRHKDREPESHFKLVVIDSVAKTFETLNYELQTQPSNLAEILSFAQPSENELNFLLKDVNDFHGEHIVELHIDLPALSVSEAKVDFSGQSDQYLASPYLEDGLVAPKDYLFYLTDSYSRTASYGDSTALVEGVVLMDAQTHDTQIITQDELKLKIDGITYGFGHMMMHGEDLFMYASSQKGDFGVDMSEAPVAQIFKYVATEFESIRTYDARDFNYSLRHGIYYQSYAINDKVVRLKAFDPSVGEVVYQADFHLQTDQDIRMNPLYVR